MLVVYTPIDFLHNLLNENKRKELIFSDAELQLYILAGELDKPVRAILTSYIYFTPEAGSSSASNWILIRHLPHLGILSGRKIFISVSRLPRWRYARR